MRERERQKRERLREKKASSPPVDIAGRSSTHSHSSALSSSSPSPQHGSDASAGNSGKEKDHPAGSGSGATEAFSTGREVVIDFIGSRVWDHSAIVAIDTLARQYHELGVTLHLRHLSPDCRALLLRSSDVHLTSYSTILDVDAPLDPSYQVADDYNTSDLPPPPPTLRLD